jgi:phosphoribosylglycinamide formyltransferase 1
VLPKLVAEKTRVAVLISGRGSNAAALIYASKVAGCPYEIVLVASDNPQAEGLKLAHAEGIAAIDLPSPTPKDKSQFFVALDKVVLDHRADMIALAGFMRILPADFIEKWQGRIINIHPSLLPKYKGLHTHERALANSDTIAGCTVHHVTTELDGGATLGQVHVAVLAGDTPDSLAARVLIAEHQLYPRVLADFAMRVKAS